LSTDCQVKSAGFQAALVLSAHHTRRKRNCLVHWRDFRLALGANKCRFGHYLVVLSHLIKVIKTPNVAPLVIAFQPNTRALTAARAMSDV
jgi:hypothetical protein